MQFSLRRDKERKDKDKRDKAPQKDHIGLFCGNFNAGINCDSARCSRLHRCSRWTSGSFCRENHSAADHQ